MTPKTIYRSLNRLAVPSYKLEVLTVVVEDVVRLEVLFQIRAVVASSFWKSDKVYGSSFVHLHYAGYYLEQKLVMVLDQLLTKINHSMRAVLSYYIRGVDEAEC